MLNLFKKFRRMTSEDFLPWTGGDESDPLPALSEKYADNAEPKREAMRAKQCWETEIVRLRTHNPTGHQSGTKGRYIMACYTGSHGWRGRK